MISVSQMVIAMFILSSGARIRGSVRRWRQPLVRGPEWFFNVPVPPGFYSGPGKKILNGYRLRMFAPIAVETLLAAVIFFSGHVPYLYWLIVGASIAIHVNHLFSVDLAERQARRFAVPEEEQPVSSVVLSLTPRRLRDYTNRGVEGFIIFASLGTLAWLVRMYLVSPAQHSLGMLFGVPVMLVYFQLGFLFVKSGIVGWRTPIPQAQADEHLQAREAARKLYLKCCDWSRVFTAVTLVFWPVLLSVPPEAKGRALTIFVAAILVISVVGQVWQEMGRLSVLKTSLRARPAKMPTFLHTENSNWLVCYQPDTPMLLIRGARGYSLNLANKLAPLGAAYLVGLAALFVLLR